MTKKTKAILFMILSACSFSVMQLAVKLSGGIPMMQQVFVRNFFTLFIGFYMAMSHHVGSPFGKKENQKALFFRGVLGYLGVVMYFYASVICMQQMQPCCIEAPHFLLWFFPGSF